MKARYRTEAQILKRIDQARHRRDEQQVLAWNLHEQTVKFWQKADAEQNEEHRAHGNTLELQSKTAARAVARYNERVLPTLGRKLSEFRTALMPLPQELRPYDHSVEV